MSETLKQQVASLKASASEYRNNAERLRRAGWRSEANKDMRMTRALEAALRAMEDRDTLLAALLDLAGNAGAVLSSSKKHGAASGLVIECLKASTDRAIEVFEQVARKMD